MFRFFFFKETTARKRAYSVSISDGSDIPEEVRKKRNESNIELFIINLLLNLQKRSCNNDENDDDFVEQDPAPSFSSKNETYFLKELKKQGVTAMMRHMKG